MTDARAPRPMALALLWILTLAAPTQAASVRTVPNGDGTSAILLSGRIVEGDADSFRQAIQAGGTVTGVTLDSGGGLISEGAKIAMMTRANSLTTVVPDRTVCASSCFMIFAAGKRRIVGIGAKVGVHGASEVGGVDNDGSKAATVKMAQFVAELGVPNAVIGKMVVTPPKDIIWLTQDDLVQMGALSVGASGVATFSVPRPRITPADAWVPSYADAMGATRQRRR